MGEKFLKLVERGLFIVIFLQFAVKLLIKDTPKEDKPPNKRQDEVSLVFTLYRKRPLKEDNLPTKDKTKVLVYTLQGRRNMSQPGGAEIKWATLDCG